LVCEVKKARAVGLFDVSSQSQFEDERDQLEKPFYELNKWMIEKVPN
jgi:hypothetical protein